MEEIKLGSAQRSVPRPASVRTTAVLPRLWIAAIVAYNLVSGVLAILDPAALERVFPGSAEIFGTEASMLSRVLGSYALSIAGVRAVFVLRPHSNEAFWSVIWTFFVFESMFALEVCLGLAFSTVAFGVFAGTASVVLLFVYKACGWLEEGKGAALPNEKHA